MALFRGIRPGSRDEDPPTDPRDMIDDEMWKLMDQCWSQDPSARPTARQIIQELEWQGVSQRDNEDKHTTVPETITGVNTVNIDLNEVQGILDEVSSLAARPPTNQLMRPRLTTRFTL